jgi:hypothetical protein
LNGKKLFFPSTREHYESFVECRDYSEMLRETPAILREMVSAWMRTRDSDFGLEIFLETHPELRKDIRRHWEATPTALTSAEIGGGAAIALMPNPGPTPYQEALRFFVWLITNPKCDKLEGPCARCGNYYMRRSVRNKAYCSRFCGTRATALAATRKRRDEEHADKLLRAAGAAREWTTERTKQGWKPWVSRRHPDITLKFLTRAVNKGELKPPTKGKKA